jgi:ribosome-associated protein
MQPVRGQELTAKVKSEEREPYESHCMKKDELRAQVAIAVHACHEKKAENITVLQLDEQASGFTDYFVLCSGANPRQVQAIADGVDEALSAARIEPKHREGYEQADWVLIDYVDFVVHIFSEAARKFYDLERLWKTAKRLEATDLEKPVKKPAAKKAAKHTSAKTTGPAAKSTPRKRGSSKHKSPGA